VVPAFTGLGSPWWDPSARGAIFGLTRGTTRAHLARAVVEAMAFQVHDVLEAMARAGHPVRRLAVDGGASAMDLLLQLQADLSGVEVARAPHLEATARGAALAAGLGAAVFPSLEDVPGPGPLAAVFLPSSRRSAALAGHDRWLRALERTRGLALDTTPTRPGESA
jgi:glycerol kinase